MLNMLLTWLFNYLEYAVSPYPSGLLVTVDEYFLLKKYFYIQLNLSPLGQRKSGF
jgi:hypothetical protein